MFLDQTLSFNTTLGVAQTVSGTADSAAIVDITGAGSGNAPAMINGFPATNTAIGEDYGAGDGLAIPHVLLTVPVVGTGAGTVTISVQSAPDDGSYGQGSYTTLVSTPALVGTALAAGTVIDIPLPPERTGVTLPRFYKLVYTVSGTFSAGFIAELAINPAQVYTFGKYANNYIVV